MSNTDGGHTSMVWVLARRQHMFQIGKRNQLFKTLGLVYGHIYLEDREPFPVVDVATASGALDSLVQSGDITGQEAQEILDQMRTAGMAQSLKAVFELVSQVALPEGFVPSYHFVLHDCELPVPHGYIRGEDGKSEMLDSFIDGLNLVNSGVRADRNPLHVLDGVNLLKEMTACGLPLTRDDSRAKYAALPEETRRNLERQSGLIGGFNIPGLGNVLVMELGLPVRGGQQPTK